MASHFHRDYETRSVIDLKRTGARVYMQHPTTSIWCCAYTFDEEPIRLWTPGQPVPGDVVEAALMGDVEAWAHNNAFEAIVEEYIAGPRHGFPQFDPRAQRCTMVGAYAMGLPGALENTAPALGLDLKKDMTGKRLMMQMARPRKVKMARGFSDIPFTAVRVQEMDADGWEVYEDGKGRLVAEVQWWNQPEKVVRLGAYCVDDVAVERALGRRLRALSPSEMALWHLDQKVNRRGCLVDAKLANAAKAIVKEAQHHLDSQMRENTDGAVSKCSNRNELVSFVRGHGIECDSINKAAMEELLEESNTLPPIVRKVLELRKESAKASVAKIDALLNGKSPDTGRACDLLQFHGASTGRWAGRRAQWQNVKRPDESDIDTLIDVVATGDFDYLSMMFDKPLSAVGDILRGLIVAAPGHRIVAADYSNIEGRVLAWLAGESWKLRAFRDFDDGTGHDLYKLTAAGILNKRPEDVTKDERQSHGKVPELALGYQGGVGAFSTMAANYGLDLPVIQIEAIRDGWREKHPNIKQYWYDMENAAVSAVREKGSVQSVGRIRFKQAGSFLFMQLPSKRFLCYPYPEVRTFDTPWGEPKQGITYFSTIDVSKKAKVVDDPKNSSNWARIKTYGGMLVENATQAVARDVLADAMPRLETAGYPIVLTVHDEVVCEVPDGHGSVEDMESIMCDLPEWAAGLPISAEGFEGERYRK